MAIVQIPGAARESEGISTTTPLVMLFERDDAIAVPLLSQLRLANYDVRSSRTPVELFDILSKNLVALVLVDLGNATASRREFWVALDAQRKGRAIQVMTFRYIQPSDFFDSDFDAGPRALADVEVHGAHEFQLLVEGVRQRIPLGGSGNTPFDVSGPFAPGMNVGMGAGGNMYPGGIAPIGAALGVPSPFMQVHPGAQPAYPGAYDPYGAASAASAPTGRPMPPVYPYGQPAAYPSGQAASFTSPPTHAWPFPPPVVSSGFPSTPQPGFGSSPFEMSPFSASDPNSPFAHPGDINPFAQEAQESQFAQPYSANPFATDVRDSAGLPETANPFAAADANSRGPSAISPMGASNPGSSDPWWANMSGAAGGGAMGFGPGAGDYAAGFAVAEPAARPFPGMHGFSARNGNAISDVWTPPDEDFDQQTGVVPEISFAPAHPAPTSSSSFESAWSAPTEHRAAEPGLRFPGGERATDLDMLSDDTAPFPVPSRLPAVRRSTPTEAALGNVLVEGALLSPQRLEALRGIQQMLSGVEMNFKLGELALLFKFLSPDQLLAALLVSRGLVSPGQIAGLGRVKQELGATGMDYDLETLLGMFHILPADQLHELRAELAGQ